MRKTIRCVTCGDLTAIYRQETETGVLELLLLPAGMEKAIVRDDCAAEPLVQLKLLQDDSPAYFSGGRTMRNSPSSAALAFQKQDLRQCANETDVITTLTDARGYECVHILHLYADNAAAEIITEFYNGSKEPVILEMLSSFTLGSLSPFSRGLATETLIVHRMRSTWSAEGRLISTPAEDLQLEPSWKQYSANSVRFGSVGSFPVREWVPFCAVEDKSHCVTWAAATTQGSSWQMELYRRDYGLSISGGLADREQGQWYKQVNPSEHFTAPKAILTAVCGDVDAAAQKLAENTRRALRIPAGDQDMPVLFNEFCTTWGVPTEESVLQQIEKLKGRGIGIYVIDAGWFDNHAFDEATRLGKWAVSESAFPHGLRPVVEAIHSAGMRAGIWFEFEMVGRDEPECFEKTDWLLKRDGVPVTAGNRRFWDMRKPEVQKYLAEKVISFLRNNEFDYMKVDYNESIGTGCDGAESLGEGLWQQIAASQAFFALIRHELPDLILEVCASGGHRLCHSFLELAAMASFSDAHECDEIPIIAANMHRMILPRQSQIWAVLQPGHSLQKLYYQLCSGLLGRLCLSGNIGRLSAQQWQVVERGIIFYKKVAPIIDRGVTVRLGSPIASYRNPRGWQTILRREGGHTLLVVHTFHDAPSSLTIPVKGSIVDTFCCERLAFARQNGELTIGGLMEFDAVALLLKNED